MFATFPVGQGLMPCFDQDSNPLPLGRFDQSNSFHVRLISACNLRCSYYKHSVYYSGDVYCIIYWYTRTVSCLRVLLIHPRDFEGSTYEQLGRFLYV